MQENMTPNEEENQPELIHTGVKISSNDLKTVLITIFYMFE